MSVQVRKKKHILCALYFGETIKLVIFCMMKTLMRKNKINRWKIMGFKCFFVPTLFQIF